MDGFTYNGIHCETYGVYYTSDPEDEWFKSPEFDVYDTNIAWRHGGVYYGNAVKTRVFTLDCYYEEISIATREKIRKWLDRRTGGPLIFDDKPFVYWNVRPTKVVSGNRYNDNNGTYSGKISITFTAYEPFGYLMRKYNINEEDDASDYCGLIDYALMPDAPAYSDTSFDIYNPGTEDCGLTLVVGGSTENPVMFLNERNNSSCIFESFPSGTAQVSVDGETGMVELCYGGTNTHENGYAYHDKGIIRLEPDSCQSAGFTDGGANGTMRNIVLSGVAVTRDLIGSRILFDNVSDLEARVSDVNIGYHTVICTLTGNGTLPASGTCEIMTINHITVLEKNSYGTFVTPSTFEMNYITVDYLPKIL